MPLSDESTADFADDPTEIDDAEPDAAEPPPPARSEAEIRALVAEALPLVPGNAHQIARLVGGNVDRSELESLGNAAVFEAARDFDPSRSSFGAYARRRI